MNLKENFKTFLWSKRNECIWSQIKLTLRINIWNNQLRIKIELYEDHCSEDAAPVLQRSWVRFPFKPEFFQVSSFQLLKFKTSSLRWSSYNSKLTLQKLPAMRYPNASYFKFYPRNIYTTFVNSKPSEIKNVLYPLGEMILHLNFHFFTHCLMFKESDPPSWHCVPTSVIHHFQGPRKSSIYHCWKESCSIRSWKHLSLSLG